MSNEGSKFTKEMSRRTVLQAAAAVGAVPALMMAMRPQRENVASGRRLPKLAARIGQLRQLQAVHCAVELQIRRRRRLGQRLVQDLGKGLTP